MSQSWPLKGVGRPDPVAFGRSLEIGIGINLLVSDIEAQLKFLCGILRLSVRYWDDDFAILEGYGGSFMLHHDRTYRNHPFGRAISFMGSRSGGIELRLYGCDPDAACARADGAGSTVLAEAQNKPHGVREAYILGPDGFVWVPTRPDNA